MDNMMGENLSLYCCTVLKNEIYQTLPQQLVGSPRDCLKHRSSADHIGPEGPEVGNGRRFQEHHQAVQYETGRIMLNSC